MVEDTRFPAPGDMIFARTKGLYGAVIRFGQALRWWRGRDWNHMAIIDSIDEAGNITILEMARRCDVLPLEDVAPGGRLKFAPAPPDVDIERALTYARSRIGTKYGVLTIFAIAFNIVTPKFVRLNFRRDDTLICSALVARAYEHGGWDCPVDPFQITPAEFDQIIYGTGTEIEVESPTTLPEAQPWVINTQKTEAK